VEISILLIGKTVGSATPSTEQLQGETDIDYGIKRL